MRRDKQVAYYLGPPASSCRKGVHRDPGDLMKDNRQSIKDQSAGGRDSARRPVPSTKYLS